MTTTQTTQTEHLVHSIQQSIKILDLKSKTFIHLVLADFYLKADEDQVTTADGAVELLRGEVIPFVSDEMEFQTDATHKEILAAIANYLLQEPDTLKAIHELEKIADNLADEIVPM